MGVGGVGNRGGSVVRGGGDASVADGGADGGGARWRVAAGFPMGFSESSGKASHIASHSRLI